MKSKTIAFLLSTSLGVVPVEALAHDPIALTSTGGKIVHGHTYGPAVKYDNVVIRGAQVFSGCHEQLTSADVLVTDNRIAEIGPDLEAPEDAFEIKADGHTLIPGLIDAHWHGVYAEATIPQILTTGEGYWNLVAARAQENALYRGFTTVREAAGPMFDIARATDEGLIVGPRIFPSGPAISQTSGHMDFRFTYDVPATPDKLHSLELNNGFYIADGVPEVIKRVRENLMQGATQIKLMAGGGVTSSYDPIHTIQYSDAELEAAVEAAENWGTYVLTHAISDEAVIHSLDAGVKSIEHGHMATRETLERIRDEEAWLSMQPFLDDEDAPTLNEAQSAKYNAVVVGTDFVYRTARELGVKIAFGTDTLFSSDLAMRQGAQLAKLQRWFTPFEALKMATCDNAELLKLSGPLTPYPDGPLGVIEEGAYADLIIVKGNPLEDLDLVGDPEGNFDLIMKDGVIYKNQIDR
ncbi:Imidazolonepropionase [Cribrihabitans marinus]|uniref:Imidazolonepropionase n=1 Tax=Cribrihabitans marinus TaxID=1227549 RepID=A0A1H7E1K5_9RHOB|nr:amidohydrolase family protein [Cribrihabitans marinus]GGH41675.1 hydrolase [Cribrihabitans marinus]SEK07584.1 Imidazolonepropionase [Cribrihabitans marinus]